MTSPRRAARRGARPIGAIAVPRALAAARIPPAVLGVLETLDRAGRRSWIVGGAVRDLLLHRGRREAADYDVATPATPDEVMRLFRRVVPTGVEHGTVTVLAGREAVEVTTFRGEGAYVDGRRPSSVTFHHSIDEDLARRDFTLNALAWDPLGREFRDPFGGRDDIRRRVIRAVGDPAARFGEDGLRAVRAVRFAAQLGYDVEPRTLAAIPGSLDVVRKVSVERIAEELTRLLAAPHVRRGLDQLARAGLLEVALPSIDALPRTALAHAIRVAASLPPVPDALRFAGLLHLLPAAEAGRALVALRLPNRLATEVEAILTHAPCVRKGPPSEDAEEAAEVRRWLSRVGAERAGAVLALRQADAADAGDGARARREQAAARRFARHVRRVAAAAPPLSIGDLAVGGRDVMRLLRLPPGPEVGDALQHLLERVLEDPSRNARSALEAELRAWALERVEDGDA